MSSANSGGNGVKESVNESLSPANPAPADPTPGEPPPVRRGAGPWVFRPGGWLFLLGAILFVAATAYDLEWVWGAARVPSSGLLDQLGGTLLEGRGVGVPDLAVLIYGTAALLFGAGFLAGAPSLLRHWRRALGELALGALLTLVALHLLRMLFARHSPIAVLGDSMPYAPWWLPGAFLVEAAGGIAGASPLSGWWMGGSFPALSSTLAGLIAALAWRIPGRYWPARRLMVYLTLLPAFALGVLEVYAQQHWPTDVLAGIALGVFAPPWITRLLGGNRSKP